jgi:hypothetical protein
MYWEQNTVRCEGVLYQLPIQLKSAGSWKELRQLFRGQTDGADGKTLRQPTFREIVALVLSAKNERQNPQAERVMQELKKRQYLTGDTLVLWTREGFCVVDHPDDEVVEQLGKDDQHTLDIIQRKINQIPKRLGITSGFLKGYCPVRNARKDHMGEEFARGTNYDQGLAALLGEEIMESTFRIPNRGPGMPYKVHCGEELRDQSHHSKLAVPKLNYHPDYPSLGFNFWFPSGAANAGGYFSFVGVKTNR